MEAWGAIENNVKHKLNKLFLEEAGLSVYADSENYKCFLSSFSGCRHNKVSETRDILSRF